MPDTRPLQVFISYARPDREVAMRVCDAFQNSSVDVWTFHTPDPAKQTVEAWERALENADTTIVIWSDASLRSRYASLELGYALGRAQTTQTMIVPIVVGDARVPKALQRFQPLAANPEGIGALAARIAATRPGPEPASNVVSLWDDANETATSAPRKTGTVKWFDAAKGFGFIAPDDGGNDLFVHASALERAGIGTLNEGDRLSYEFDNRTGKSQLANLRLTPRHAR